MVSDFHIKDVSVVSGPQSAVTQVQNMPQEGKTLPPEAKQNSAESVNIEQLVQNMNDQVQLTQRNLQFSIDKDSDRTVITVLDSETQEVIRQIPTEEALQLSRNLQQGYGIELFDQFA